MAGRDGLVVTTSLDVFMAERPRLVGLAYRMLGTWADAEDAVQDAWLRWDGVGDTESVDNPAAYLTTIVTRLALDRLRVVKRERDRYVGPWLAEPVVKPFDAGCSLADPAETVELAETLTLGFLSLLEALSPLERAAFLLREVFDEPYPTVAAAVDRSEAACRQIVHRARERLRVVGVIDAVHGRTGRAGSREREADVFARFCLALATGDVDSLRSLMTDDVVLVSDGGPNRHAARRPVLGVYRVCRLLVNLARRLPLDLEYTPVRVNGQPGMVFHRRGVVDLVWSIEVVHDRVVAFRSVLNPEKLARVRVP